MLEKTNDLTDLMFFSLERDLLFFSNIRGVFTTAKTRIILVQNKLVSLNYLAPLYVLHSSSIRTHPKFRNGL